MESSNVVYAEPVSEKTKISYLEKKIAELIEINQKLSNDNERIINSISNFAPFIGDDYHWIKIDKACLTANEPKMNDNPFSGESFDESKMKKRMITQNYWGCYVSEDGKCYYTPAKYKYILASLVPVPISKDEKSFFYIRIPNIDMKTNKDGFGKLRNFGSNKKMYHGDINHTSNRGKFIVRKDKLRNFGYDLSSKHEAMESLIALRDVRLHSRWLWPNLSMCDNIQYDAEYYCTNCKCISEGSNVLGSWKLYQCMGH